MFNDLLENYNDSEYVYIIESCLNTYVSKSGKIDDTPCEVCGEYDYLLASGLVRDIKEAQDLEDLHERKTKNVKMLKKSATMND